ncbi:DNA polymerase III subunit gamma/tau [Helicovermis profundi]|uniref:DNA-directed DNA polymerase n=1 Tax=Helicovermis profundi TaxID=3065157 RepID=A0AAU9E8E5_9FIRM|nr:DNA polymerase III subunit gamma/tau [Clostridia bacterium S502]
MAYTALYRKWRPNIFEEIIGQKHIVDTLKNQIKNNQIGHAYLFNGTRGTGKTTIARVFSRAINCINSTDFNPCNKCDICQGILNETLMDVIEIDAASNNGVDNIRELRENIKYPPSKAKYKVYIIDEVHMLSQGAFNALLKILEEPPNYVVFILATTELHKIPDTIHSRCQTYSFKRVTYDDIKKRMIFILEDMKILYEEKALEIIIKKGEGAVRDSLSLLDQCISFTEGKILYEKVIDVLGLSNEEIYFDIFENIINKNPANLIKIVDDVFNSGKNINFFIKDLIEYNRNIMIVNTSTELLELLDISDERKNNIKEQAKKISTSNIIRILEILLEADNAMKYSNNPRVSLEITLLKIVNLSFDNSIEGIVERIIKIEKKIESGNIITSSNQSEKTVGSNSTASDIDKKVVIENQSASKIQRNVESDTILQKENIIELSIDNNTFNKIENSWSEILSLVRKNKVSIHAFLIEGSPKYMDENRLIIGFDDKFGFHLNAVMKKENKEVIENIIFKVINSRVNIVCKFTSELGKIVNDTKDDENEITKKVEEFFNDSIEKLEIIE